MTSEREQQIGRLGEHRLRKLIQPTANGLVTSTGRHRTGDPFDVIADWAGIAVGVLVFGLIVQRRSHSRVEGLAPS